MGKIKVEEYLKKDKKDISLIEIEKLPDDIFYSIDLNWLCEWGKYHSKSNYAGILNRLFKRSVECSSKDADVLDFFIDKGVVSASKIQVNFCCGYPTAVRIVEKMKEEGLVEDNKDPQINYHWIVVKKDKDAMNRIIQEVLGKKAK